MTYSRTEKLRTPMPKSSSRERPRVGVSSQKKKPVGDGINQTAGDFDAISLATQYQIESSPPQLVLRRGAPLATRLLDCQTGSTPLFLPQQDPPRILGLGRILRRMPERGLRLVQGSQELRSQG